MIRTPSRSRLSWCAMRASIRLSCRSQRAQEFAQGGPIYGQQLTAKELRERFGL